MIKLLDNEVKVKQECLNLIGTEWLKDKEVKDLRKYIEAMIVENDVPFQQNYKFHLSGFDASKEYDDSLIIGWDDAFVSHLYSTRLVNVLPLLADSYHLKENCIEFMLWYFNTALKDYKFIVERILNIYNSYFKTNVVVLKENRLFRTHYYLSEYNNKEFMKFLFDVMYCFYSNNSMITLNNLELLDYSAKLFISNVNELQFQVLTEIDKYFDAEITLNRI